MIEMLGIDHNNAPLEVRSLFTFRKQEKIDLMERVKTNLQAEGAVLLATCNRMELWVSGPEAGEELLNELCAFKGLSSEDYAQYFRYRSGEEAISHLFALTCGLKSAIVAEDQILTQVKEALAFSREAYLSDSVLEVLFRMAVSAAKKVKTNVVFTHADNTAIDHALSMLARKGFTLQGKKCMVIGNGEYGRLAATTLARRGADVTVTVRQYHSGMVMIPEGCQMILYGDKMDLFPQCDLVVSATTSPNYTLFFDKVEPLKVDHPMILIDFAVPRDIDPDIAKLPGYTIYDIDDFQSDPGAVNEEAYAQAQAILDDQIHEFHLWMDYRDLVPHIGHIREAAVSDIHARLHREVRKILKEDDLAKKMEDRIDTASGKVVAKMMFMLRDALDEETFRRCVSVIEEGYAEEGEAK